MWKMDKVEELRDPISDYVREHRMPGLMPVGDVRIQPSGLVMPKEFVPDIDRIREFEVRPDDVWLISFPKCGTTWSQELIWLIGNDLDYEASNKKLLLSRFPFLEAWSILGDDLKQGENPEDEWFFRADTIEYIKDQPSPRYIKTHLPASLLPEQIWTVKPKIIYVTRNPKDAAVSYYHHHRLWNGYSGIYPLFMQAFLEDKLVYCPFWEHVLSYKTLENNENLLINSYEEMKKDMPSVIQKTAKFLGKTLSEDEITKLAEHLSFKNMKGNGAINGEEVVEQVRQRYKLDSSDPGLCFIRKGEVDSWKEEMTPDIAKQFDVWTAKKTKGTILENK
ncbi:Sulfotransferase domain [Nesidiocoris tenuis]|uniref:Sulfotransferase domain n=1 Tax=Nesidiocoris tenuis TaxID=355587 RepID=A0ABN7B568_9HEMI|nr:Sulfotransferase domain [Nesidiocoris tenuis]